jgi:hypothetical protein
MKPNLAGILFAALALGAAAQGDDAVNRAKLSGAWQSGTGTGAATWILDQKADAAHITYLEGDRKLADFECNTMGHECAVKEAGKSAKVSIWFSGAKLVELETRGREVVKRRFAVAEQGDTLEVEVIPIMPEGKAETLYFRRVRR